MAAQEEARELRHDYVFPEHLALGLLHEPDGLAARAVVALGVNPEAARETLVAVLLPAVVDEPVSSRSRSRRGPRRCSNWPCGKPCCSGTATSPTLQADVEASVP